MKNITPWIASVVCLPVAMAVAQSSYEAAGPLFRENEFSLDAFGSVSVGQQIIDNISGNRVEDDGRLGAGLGLNYFLTRHIGVGADAYTENAGDNFVDNTSGNLILRIPIEGIRLAPYAFGGAGYQFDPDDTWFGQAGAGVEFRLARKVSLFADARYVMPDKIDNFGVARAGLRVAL